MVVKNRKSPVSVAVFGLVLLVCNRSCDLLSALSCSHTCSLPSPSILTKCNFYQACKSCSFLHFHLFCDTMHLSSQEKGKWASSFPHPSLLELMVVTHSNSLSIPCSSLSAFLLHLPFCVSVVYVMNAENILGANQKILLFVPISWQFQFVFLLGIFLFISRWQWLSKFARKIKSK